ncbi:hypothetical protein [Aliidiomarina indica]|nr:hypothetical protein [Aliidiomarina indica]
MFLFHYLFIGLILWLVMTPELFTLIIVIAIIMWFLQPADK